MISRSSLIFTCAIFGLIFVARPLLKALLTVIDRGSLGIALSLALVAAGAWVVLTLVRSGSLKASILLLLVTALGTFYANSLAIAEERVHILIFGTLGFLLTRDLHGSYPRPTLTTIALCGYVAALDECVQWFHPLRVGDPHDVLVGSIGGALGAAFARILYGGTPR